MHDNNLLITGGLCGDDARFEKTVASYNDKPKAGEVIAIGEGRYTATGKLIPMVVKVGDMVVLPTQGFTKLPFDGEEYYVGPKNQILCRVSTEEQIEQALKDTEAKLTKQDINDLTDI